MKVFIISVRLADAFIQGDVRGRDLNLRSLGSAELDPAVVGGTYLKIDGQRGGGLVSRRGQVHSQLLDGVHGSPGETEDSCRLLTLDEIVSSKSFLKRKVWGGGRGYLWIIVYVFSGFLVLYYQMEATTHYSDHTVIDDKQVCSMVIIQPLRQVLRVNKRTLFF